MFRKQFKLATHKEKDLKELCIFGILVYIKAWFTAPVAQEASDLNLTKSLLQPPNVAVSKSTLNKLSKHFWYLSEEFVALSFFNGDVSLEVKRRMVDGSFKEKMTRKNPQKDHNIRFFS